MAKASSAPKIRPIGDKVILKRLEAEGKTKGGIVLPDSAKEKPQKGTVVAVGEGRITKDGKRVPIAVSKGDTVLFSSYAGTEIKVGGEEYMVMDETDILAIID